MTLGRKQKLAAETDRARAGHTEPLQLAQRDAACATSPAAQLEDSQHATPTVGKEPSPSRWHSRSFPIGQKEKSGPRFVHQAQQDMAKLGSNESSRQKAVGQGLMERAA